MDFCGTKRNAQHFGCFLGRKLFQMYEYEGFALTLWQLLERDFDASPQRAVSGRGGGRRQIRIRQRVGAPDSTQDLPAFVAGDFSHQNSKEPGAQARLPAKSRKAIVGSKKRFLGHVLRRAVASKESCCRADRRTLVFVHEHAKSRIEIARAAVH